MGCASGMGLGVALATRRRVAVLDGDGAVLMKLGSLATIGAYRPGNLTHILYDNGVSRTRPVARLRLLRLSTSPV